MMIQHMRIRFSVIMTALILTLSPLAGESAQQVNDTIGTHVVESGDTLWSITEKYLGEDFLWRENWKLNPQIKNPNLLRIGQELKVITERKVIADNATIAQISNQVDKNLQSTNWTPASHGDALQSKDGIRTREASSASLRFNDATWLNLSEFSQVFLQSKLTDLRGVDRGQIEVRRGRVEMAFEPIAGNPAQIELVVGSASARPDVGPDGSAQMAAVADEESGGAAVMVYHGNSSVEAAGAQVQLVRGTGSTVPANGPPSPPERLLPRPRGLAPENDSEWPVANPILSWEPVDLAAGYVVEVCVDSACEQLVQKSSLIESTRWQPRLKATGDYHWRVRGVSESGLEGYASRVRKAYLASTLIDEQPPQVAVVPVGFVTWSADRLLVSDKTRLSLSAHDAGIGVSWVRYRFDDGDWQTWQDASIELSAATSGYMELQSADLLDNVGDIVRIELISIQ